MVTAITGSGFGDEGKGKTTDLLAEKADIVVRFQGGANAGHTIINDFGKFVLRLLPSGVFHHHVENVIASGVAFDADIFFSELEMLKERGVPTPKILISSRAQLLLPIHKLQDRLEEERLGKNRFGSTLSETFRYPHCIRKISAISLHVFAKIKMFISKPFITLKMPFPTMK